MKKRRVAISNWMDQTVSQKIAQPCTEVNRNFISWKFINKLFCHTLPKAFEISKDARTIAVKCDWSYFSTTVIKIYLYYGIYRIIIKYFTLKYHDLSKHLKINFITESLTCKTSPSVTFASLLHLKTNILRLYEKCLRFLPSLHV